MENEGNGTMKIFGGVTVTVKRLEVGWCIGGGSLRNLYKNILKWGGVVNLGMWVAGYELSMRCVGLPMTRELALNPGIHKANCDHDNH